MRKYTATALMGSLLAVGGCASIMHGTTQKIGISSAPTGAQVSVDNKQFGTTPVFADLKRKEEHVITITMPGYETAQLTVTKKVSGWVWGNIVLGGLIGLAVDAISGGLYTLTPEQLNAELKASTASAANTAGGITILAVLNPDPSWTKIGSLEPSTADR